MISENDRQFIAARYKELIIQAPLSEYEHLPPGHTIEFVIGQPIEHVNFDHAVWPRRIGMSVSLMVFNAETGVRLRFDGNVSEQFEESDGLIVSVKSKITDLLRTDV